MLAQRGMDFRGLDFHSMGLNPYEHPEAAMSAGGRSPLGLRPANICTGFCRAAVNKCDQMLMFENGNKC